MELLDHDQLNFKKPREVPKPQDWMFNDHIARKFDSHLRSTAAYVPVKFQIDCKSPNRSLAASGLHEIMR